MKLPAAASGGVPEWLKGTDCKSVGFAYVGSNPTPSTSLDRRRGLQSVVFLPPTMHLGLLPQAARLPISARSSVLTIRGCHHY